MTKKPYIDNATVLERHYQAASEVLGHPGKLQIHECEATVAPGFVPLKVWKFANDEQRWQDDVAVLVIHHGPRHRGYRLAVCYMNYVTRAVLLPTLCAGQNWDGWQLRLNNEQRLIHPSGARVWAPVSMDGLGQIFQIRPEITFGLLKASTDMAGFSPVEFARMVTVRAETRRLKDIYRCPLDCAEDLVVPVQ